MTKEDLLSNGWVLTNDPIFPITKCLTDKEHEDYDEEDGELSLVVHYMRNIESFAISMPDGGLLDLNISSIDDLKFIEKMILGYMPNY